MPSSTLAIRCRYWLISGRSIPTSSTTTAHKSSNTVTHCQWRDCWPNGGLRGDGCSRPAVGTDPTCGEGNPYRKDAMDRTRLSVHETRALLSVARREGTTVNGVVCAALIDAARNAFGVATSALLYRYPVDLRRHMSAAVAATECTTSLGQATYIPATDYRHDFYALARDVTAALHQELADRRVLRPAVRWPAYQNIPH